MRNYAVSIGVALITSAAVSALALTGCSHTAALTPSADRGTSMSTPATPASSTSASRGGSSGNARAHEQPHAPASGTAPDSAPATSSSAASAPSRGTAGTAPLPNGIYIDASDGQPHYVVMLSRSRTAVSGTVTYLYQDGRTSTSVRYTGQLSGDGRLTITLGNGQAMTGTYQFNQFTLSNCGQFLPDATQLGACHFAYNGHNP